MEFHNEGEFASIILNRESGDLEAMYNILAYYRMSNGYFRRYDCRDFDAVMCEKLFQQVRSALE